MIITNEILGVNDLNTPLRMSFERKRFLKRYGKEKAPVSTIPYAGMFMLVMF